MIEVEMPNGVVLEFPDGTPQDVMVQQAQQYMQRTMSPGERARAARAGTLEMLPGSAERTEAANLLAMGQMQPEPSVPADVARAIPAGLARGVTGAMDLPGAIVSGAGNLVAGGLERAGLVGPTFAEGIRQSMSFTPMGTGSTAREGVEMLSGGASEYQAQTTPGKFAQTTSEFLPGGLAGPARGMATRALQYGVLPGLASEAAGQTAQALGAGETGEAIARFGGAFFSPVALSTGNRTVNAFFKRSSQAPSLETLKQTKTVAYKAADDAGVVFGPRETTALSDRVKNVLANSDFVEDVDNQTRAALTVIERNAGKELSLSQLDKIRQRLWKRYQAAPNEVAILDLIDEIDTTIDAMPAATPLMEAARLANSRFKKAELIETAFQRAQDQAASTGSGGNVLNLYRQAVTRIINDPKKTRFFSQAEIDYMRQFVRGGTAENVLRLMGKVSPSGNGLMLALNLGATAVNPAMMGVAVAGAGAKAASDSMSMANAARLRDALATGQIPARAASPIAAAAPRLIPGLLAQ